MSNLHISTLSTNNTLSDMMLKVNEIIYNIEELGAITGSNNALNLGGNPASYYSPIDSPIFSGVPQAPTANSGTNNDQIATTAFVENAILSSVKLPIRLNNGDTDLISTINGFINILNNNGSITSISLNLD